jgi:hypothetical protein
MVKNKGEGSASPGQQEHSDVLTDLYRHAQNRYDHISGTRHIWILSSSLLILFLFLLSMAILFQINSINGESQAGFNYSALSSDMTYGVFFSVGLQDLPNLSVKAGDSPANEDGQLSQEFPSITQVELPNSSLLFLPLVSTGLISCRQKEDILLEVLSGPELLPEKGSRFSPGDVPKVQASWIVRNTGGCAWDNFLLYSLNDGEIVSPGLRNNTQVVVLAPGQNLVDPGVLLEVSIPFEPAEANRVLKEWVFVINGYQLFDLPHLSLNVKGWVTLNKPKINTDVENNPVPAGKGQDETSGQDRGNSSPPSRATEIPPQRP